MRDARLIEFRRHYPDVIGQCAGDLLDNLQAGSMDAVVIGAENSHPFKCLARSVPPAVKAPSYPATAIEANPAISGKMASPGRSIEQRRYRLVRISIPRRRRSY